MKQNPKTPEQAFTAAWEKARQEAAALGVHLRPIQGDALAAARRILSGHRLSDGFTALADLGRLDLTPEALAVRGRFTELFTDREANEALTRLLEAGYRFERK